MEMNDETWNTVVKTNRAIGFSGSDKMSPKPITDAEFERMVRDINSKAEKVVAQSNFNVGDKVKITHGSFQGIIGLVSGIESDKKRLNVVLKIFDRETAIDISTDEVELVKE